MSEAAESFRVVLHTPIGTFESETQAVEAGSLESLRSLLTRGNDISYFTMRLAGGRELYLMPDAITASAFVIERVEKVTP